MTAEDQDIKSGPNTNTLDILDNSVTLETVQDLTFLNMVMQEALRFEPPVNANSAIISEKDIQIGKYHIKAGTEVRIFMQGLHYNPTQWKRPAEFIPQRFDPEDEMFLTPDGKKRHTFAYAPFNGGRRVCFGKTFAEATIKILVTYFTQYFDFEMVKEKYREKDTYHPSAIGISGKVDPVMLKLSRHEAKK